MTDGRKLEELHWIFKEHLSISNHVAYDLADRVLQNQDFDISIIVTLLCDPARIGLHKFLCFGLYEIYLHEDKRNAYS